jgi:phenylacetate-coenzyme A ligase PaaK-like adenylate-forming protein
LKGRVNEWVATAMGNIAPWVFEPIFSAVPGISPDWKVVLKKKNNKDLIEFHMESSNGALDMGFVKEALYSKIKTVLPDSWKMHEMNLFHFDTQIFPKGSLRQGRKLMRESFKRFF